jgi:hypothetical protein
MTRYAHEKACIVCRRFKAEATILDGIKVDICDECAGDRFRVAEALRRALEKEGGE